MITAQLRRGARAWRAGTRDERSESPPIHRGHLPTLFACFLHFDLSFMLWVLLGALGIYAAEEASLSAAQKGLVTAIPVLGGALCRVPAGLLSDHFGAKRTGLGLLILLAVPLTLGWLLPGTMTSLLIIGALLGVGGASFAVALPLASRWHTQQRQGLVMGIAAAGNSGTVITNLAAPRLAEAYGWHAVFGLALLPLAAVALFFALVAKEAPGPRMRTSLHELAVLLREPDLLRLCAIYATTFGGYVGLCSFLPLFFRDQFGLTPIDAGMHTATIALAGSLSRPLGGYVADRVDGRRVLKVALSVVAIAGACATMLPPLPVLFVVLCIAAVALGLGNGAVFQLVPLRFPRSVGAVTGVVGAVGGLGGFLLPTAFGVIKQASGSFGPAFACAGAAAICAVLALRALEDHPLWRALRGVGSAP